MARQLSSFWLPVNLQRVTHVSEQVLPMSPAYTKAAECVEGDPGLPTKRGQRGAPAARGLLSLVTFFAEAKKVTHLPG